MRTMREDQRRWNRREFVAACTGVTAALGLGRVTGARPGSDGEAPARPSPTPSQLDWQADELALFFHFGVNTFTDREWGDGTENPGIFAPAALDARQWTRAARAGGARAAILTAKHHDGFCLWPTKTTDHSVAKSPWRAGHGDLVREFVEACRAEGLKAGVYLSPWDRHEPRYGDSSRYNDFYCDQLTELLTQYGEIHEVWFDGANGEGPNGRKQEYDWPRFWGLVRRLQPRAVIFSDAGPDVRWIGNERGIAGDPNWSTVDPAVVPYPGAGGRAVRAMLQNGDPNGSAWRPGEADVSIRPGWFYHPAEDSRVKTVDDLVGLYFSSVGRNSKLLLNVPPTRDGLLHATDVARLAGMRERLSAILGRNLASGRRGVWRPASGNAATLQIDLGRTVAITVADLRERVDRAGQIVTSYTLEGRIGSAWQIITRGTTIGRRKLDRFEPVGVRSVRLTVQALEAPRPIELGAYGDVGDR